MIANHLTEDQLQQYALDKMALPLAVHIHLDSCGDCREKVTAYQLLFTAIKEEETPVFDFDLQELVLSQLPAPGVKTSKDNRLVYLLVVITIVFSSIAIYLFRYYLGSLFSNLSFITSLAAVIIIPMLLAQGADMYRIYQKKMKTLDLY